MLHLVDCLYYLYQWFTVNQISVNEIYLLIKYIKSVLWRVAKRLYYIEDTRYLKVKSKPMWKEYGRECMTQKAFKLLFLNFALFYIKQVRFGEMFKFHLQMEKFKIVTTWTRLSNYIYLYVVCPKSKCTDFLFKCLLDSLEITS